MMLRASFSEEIGGRRVTFALPLSGLRKLAEHNPHLFLLARDLPRFDTPLADVLAVIDAATGDPDATRHVVEVLGLAGAVERALRILTLALTEDQPDAGEGTAAA